MGNKVTREYIIQRIENSSFSRIGPTTTVCCILLENGFQVIGTSACVDPTEFDEQKGRDLAYEAAFDRIWELEGYLMTDRLWKEKKQPKSEFFGFGMALELLEKGYRVCRSGWNGKGMWLSLSTNSDSRLAHARTIDANAFWSENNREFARSNGGHATVLPCITMKTASDEILMGWLASQTDMLAKDWQLV